MIEDILTVIGIAAVWLLMCFGTYKLGRQLERKAYISQVVSITEKSYYDGYQDGFKIGHERSEWIEKGN